MKKNLLFILPLITLMGVSSCSEKKNPTNQIEAPTKEEQREKEETKWYDYDSAKYDNLGLHKFENSRIVNEAKSNMVYFSEANQVQNTKGDYKAVRGAQFGNQEINIVLANTTRITKLQRYSDSVVLEDYDGKTAEIFGEVGNKEEFSYKEINYLTETGITEEDKIGITYNTYEMGKLVKSVIPTPINKNEANSRLFNIAYNYTTYGAMIGNATKALDNLNERSYSSYGNKKEYLIDRSTKDVLIKSFFYQYESLTYTINTTTYDYNVAVITYIDVLFENNKELGYVYKSFTIDEEMLAVSRYNHTTSLEEKLAEPISLYKTTDVTEVNYSKECKVNPNPTQYVEKYAKIEAPLDFKTWFYNTSLDKLEDSFGNSSNTTLNSRLNDDTFEDYSSNFNCFYNKSQSQLNNYLVVIGNSSGENILNELVEKNLIKFSKKAQVLMEIVEYKENFYLKLKIQYTMFYIDVNYKEDGTILDVYISLESEAVHR